PRQCPRTRRDAQGRRKRDARDCRWPPRVPRAGDRRSGDRWPAHRRPRWRSAERRPDHHHHRARRRRDRPRRQRMNRRPEMPKILVLYYSSYGHIESLAEAIAEGARGAGAEVDIRRVPETAPDAVVKAAHFKTDSRYPLIENVQALADY